jgi:hypothetical protein
LVHMLVGFTKQETDTVFVTHHNHLPNLCIGIIILSAQNARVPIRSIAYKYLVYKLLA